MTSAGRALIHVAPDLVGDEQIVGLAIHYQRTSDGGGSILG
jgi:hypothetical protein